MTNPQRKPDRILIVDDDEDIVQMVSTLLTSHGYTCTTAGTGAQGAVAFDMSDADLVVTDLNMPAGDGIALVERIRRKCAVPIIIITAFNKEYAARLHRLRNVTVLRKPFDSRALLDLVQAELILHRAA